jgi:transposase
VVANTDPIGDDLWEAIQPLLPPELAFRHGGPPRVPHRAALGGIIFILRHGLRWGDLPQELGYGSGVTCRRRLRQWQALGIWATVDQVVLNWLGDLDAIDWSRASVDSVSVRAKRGGEHTGPNPTDRGKAGSKYHFLVDRQGVPLAVQLTAANVHDSKLLEPGSMRSSRSADRRVSPAGHASGPPSSTRQGLRFRGDAPRAAAARDHPTDRAAGRGVERAPGTGQVGRGADPGLGRRLSQARRPLRSEEGWLRSRTG